MVLLTFVSLFCFVFFFNQTDGISLRYPDSFLTHGWAQVVPLLHPFQSSEDCRWTWLSGQFQGDARQCIKQCYQRQDLPVVCVALNFRPHFPKSTLGVVQLSSPKPELLSTEGQIAHRAHAKLIDSISLLSGTLAFPEPSVLVALQRL